MDQQATAEMCGARADAEQFVGFGGGRWAFAQAAAEAANFPFPGYITKIELVGNNGQTGNEFTDYCVRWGTHALSAAAAATLLPPPDGCYLSANATAYLNEIGPDTIHASALQATGLSQPIRIWESANGRLIEGLNAQGVDPNDPEVDVFSSVQPVDFPTDGVVESRVLHVDFAALDADGDGRFNHRDPAALEAQGGSTDPALLDVFDADDSGVIDAPDWAQLVEFIAGGLSAERFADANGDRGVNAVDRALAADAWGSTLGMASYRIGLDRDLDGFLDASDRAAAESRWNCGDFDADGLVDFDDLQSLLTQLGETNPASATADLDGDGAVTLEDFASIQARFAGGC